MEVNKMTEQILDVERTQEQVAEQTAQQPLRTFMPRVDIFEADDNVVIVAEMPGVSEAGIEITLEKNVLTIQGQIEANFPDNYKLAYREYAVGHYKRSFTLSDDIDRDNIEAILKHGVLRLHLPKAETVKSKKITVKAGN
jgi:HSP20 family molecular chaperone IbpA